ncbi:unnamed protein product [Paramecium sonneborni]|uniref:Uncharacterized protein n=1 Tax=Paramecium sonneborni TaxID=65129 RepID=A0A8S1P1F9_9CILI|nr:unnamed protein product [Paramecium sonneborni]CAD8096890.1 unnamed protein product [Paramecium sonneborni]
MNFDSNCSLNNSNIDFFEIFHNSKSQFNQTNSKSDQIEELDPKVQNETKNIPKNIGVLLKNYLKKNHPKSSENNSSIKKFILKGIQKKNYIRKDFKTLFQNEEARKICSEYFSSFELIQDVLQSKKIGNVEIVLKYIKKLFLATRDPNTLSILKYQKN